MPRRSARRCNWENERALYARGCQVVAGIDEVGRGPLAGPVVAAVVILPCDFQHETLDDSKKLTAAQREKLYHELTSDPGIRWAAAAVSHVEIDRINILRASHEAMRRALEGLARPPDHVLIDGLQVKPFPVAQTALVGGDGLCFSIAAASVIAKVIRDRIMAEMDPVYPVYEFAKHKGYATRLHLARLSKHGPCQIHRRTFLPVAQPSLPFP
ncbi:MAG: ribonuclease HII [Verrucomicrobiota bacterium]|nr:ribonuclease HII [Verrucomicrobiota bacterium]